MTDPTTSALAALEEVLALATGNREERIVWELFNRGIIRPVGRTPSGQLIWDRTPAGGGHG